MTCCRFHEDENISQSRLLKSDPTNLFEDFKGEAVKYFIHYEYTFLLLKAVLLYTMYRRKPPCSAVLNRIPINVGDVLIVIMRDQVQVVLGCLDSTNLGNYQ